MAPTQAPLPIGAAPRLTYTVADLKRLALIAKQRGNLTVFSMISAAVARLDDDDELPVSADAAAVLEDLAR